MTTPKNNKVQRLSRFLNKITKCLPNFSDVHKSWRQIMGTFVWLSEQDIAKELVTNYRTWKDHIINIEEII